VVGDFNNTSKIFDFNFKLYQAVNGMDALNTIEVGGFMTDETVLP